MDATQTPSIETVIRTAYEIPTDEPIETVAPLDDLVAGDGEGGEGVEYRGGCISHTRIGGWWILSHGTKTAGAWSYTHTVCASRRDAEAAYIAEIERMHTEGVDWEPDVCPIWDRIEATWK